MTSANLRSSPGDTHPDVQPGVARDNAGGGPALSAAEELQHDAWRSLDFAYVCHPAMVIRSSR